jgi:Transposase DDE domain group 1
MIKGIGPIYAKKLVKAFREQVFGHRANDGTAAGGRRHRAPLPDTELAQATCGTIRLKLLKLGARVTVPVRRIKIAIASACPTRPNLLSPMPGCARRG